MKLTITWWTIKVINDYVAEENGEVVAKYMDIDSDVIAISSEYEKGCLEMEQSYRIGRVDVCTLTFTRRVVIVSGQEYLDRDSVEQDVVVGLAGE